MHLSLQRSQFHKYGDEIQQQTTYVAEIVLLLH